jgi:UDP-N-acetylmuramyl pentapeptide phosphotransferase/UDP-N-acetylglucosamine-1-phosphate transferase
MLAVLASSFAVCAMLIITQNWHGKMSLDHDLTGAQKVHKNPVPRIGGVGVMVGLLIGVCVGYAYGGSTWPIVIKLALCSLPAFGSGLIEDLTKKVSVRTRLLASFASAALAAWALNASLLRLDTPVLDELMTWTPAAILFTCFAVGGIINSINIIDGLNGLASGTVALILAGLSSIAWLVGDPLVFKLCLWGIAALAGFMLLNYPFGRIFLGDGGAYLAGFWLAECAVLLLHRNPTVSTWAVLLSALYPVCETVYTIYRRQFKQKTSSGEPDSTHLHHLLLDITPQALGANSQSWIRHGFSSAMLWLLVFACQIGAAFTANKHSVALVLVLVFVSIYIVTYRSLMARQTKKQSQINFAENGIGSTLQRRA